MNGIAIKYGDVAPGAKETFAATVNSKEDFVNLEQFKQYNLNFPNFSNPCEAYNTPLDGSPEVFPENPENENMGLWSNILSDENGKFAPNIILTLTATGQFSSQGLTLTFDTYNNVYATDLHIDWYRNNEIIEQEDFNPNSAFYFCRQQVTNYDKVVITFKSLNMPKNRLKLHSIDFGYGTYFYADELRNVKVIQEINPISAEIAINTVDFTLDSKTDMEYSFQQRQPLSVYFNDNLLATTFVTSSKRTARFLWEVQTGDYISILDTVPFAGDLYEDKNVGELLNEIATTSNIPFEIEPTIAAKTISGYIPYTTCREALMQIAFAVCAVGDTSYSDKVKIFNFSDEITQTVELERIMQGQSFTDDNTVTAVELLTHSYVKLDEFTELYGDGEKATGAVGDEILLTFTEPMHTYSGVGYTLIASGTNYIKVRQKEAVIAITGKKYQHNTERFSKQNPTVLLSELQNIKSIDNATLVTRKNVNEVLENAFNYLIINNQISMKIIDGVQEGGGQPYTYDSEFTYDTDAKYDSFAPLTYFYDKPTNIGDVIIAKTEYLGEVTGRIIKQTYNITGGILVKDTILK